LVRDVPPAGDRRAFAEQVQDALGHLHDLAYLQTHPLATILGSDPARPATHRGKALQSRLIAAIEALQAGPRVTANARAGRGYQALKLRYVEALGLPEVIGRLAISRGEYFRVQRRGLDAVTSLLLEHAGRADPGTPPPAEVSRGDITDLLEVGGRAGPMPTPGLPPNSATNSGHSSHEGPVSAESVSFGPWLRRRRRALDLTQAELARQVGYAEATIRRIEAEELRPSKELATRLAERLGVGPDAWDAFVRFARGGPDVQDVAFPISAGPVPEPPHPEPFASVPVSPTSLIGREQELVAVYQILERQEVRLLTLSGPPGIGKTRLALQVARESLATFPGGVCFVSLAAVRDPSLILPTIARALGLGEAPGSSASQVIQRYLRHRTFLLVLDNFEQVVTAAPRVAEVLAGCPRLKVLVTSREILRVTGEYGVDVPPLFLPAAHSRLTLAEVSQSAAVQLFVERARAERWDFTLTEENAEAIAEICGRLDGIPLALELAAARIRLFSPPELLDRLDRRLPLLTAGPRDAPERQQTLRRAIGWSYDLLTAEEKRLFRRLAVFEGSFDLASVGPVAAIKGDAGVDPMDGVDSLVAKSLVRRIETTGRSSFILLETIREFAQERLEENGEAETIRETHAEYFLQLAEAVDRPRRGSGWDDVVERLSQFAGNLETAIEYLLARRDADRTMRLLAAAINWHWRGWCVLPWEGWLKLDQVQQLLAAASSDLYRAQAHLVAAHLADRHLDYDAGVAHFTRALTLYRALGDRSQTARLLTFLGHSLSQRGDYVAAVPLYAEALALHRELADPGWLITTLRLAADSAVDRDDADAAQALQTEAMAQARRLGDWGTLVQCLWNDGRLAFRRGDLAGAAAAFTESQTIAGRIQDTGHLILNAYGMAAVSCRQGDVAGAERLIAETLRLAWERSDGIGILYGLDHAAVLAVARDQIERAARLAGAGTALRQTGSAGRHQIWQTLLRQAGVPLERSADDEGSATAWDEGQAMTLEQAIAYALADDPHTAAQHLGR
jgi:predicted ATPase/transcriptional regulator with XRE-family HTH domain